MDLLLTELGKSKAVLRAHAQLEMCLNLHGTRWIVVPGARDKPPPRKCRAGKCPESVFCVNRGLGGLGKSLV